MLTALVIKDFAIISKLELSFDGGMSVLTGETGAGKSIIVSALGLLLGGKSSPDVIRAGAQEASVEGMFTVDRRHAPTMAALESIGIDLEEDEFVVRRTINLKGRGKIFIGGTLQSVSTLRNLMRTVIDISGQHEHVSLLDSNRHLSIVDQFAGLEPEVAKFSECYHAWQAVKRDRDALAESLSERARRLDFINYQIDELSAARVRQGEAGEVSARLKRVSNAEAIQNAIDGALNALYDDEDSVISRLGVQISSLSRVSGGNAELEEIIEALSEAMHAIEDNIDMLRHAAVEDVSEQELSQLQERLCEIDRLERKYRVKADDLEALCRSLTAERDALELSDARIAQLDARLQEMSKSLSIRAGELSKRREQACLALSKEATEGLHLLAMPHASIEIVCTHGASQSSWKATGNDEIEFFLCPNPGEMPRPLNKIASGGELSRVLLALKRAIVEKDDVACYVFDEVDTGIGGQTATHVAQMLRDVSRCHQVLCITHLASIASYADAHFKVSKSVVNNRTESRITQLNASERVEEIARMLGGTTITDKTLAHAAEMIAQAQGASGIEE